MFKKLALKTAVAALAPLVIFACFASGAHAEHWHGGWGGGWNRGPVIVIGAPVNYGPMTYAPPPCGQVWDGWRWRATYNCQYRPMPDYYPPQAYRQPQPHFDSGCQAAHYGHPYDENGNPYCN